MADDQGPKIASIDDLVNELTKKNTNPPPPPVSVPVPEIPKPKFTTPPPSLPTMPRPAPSPIPSRPSPAPSPAPTVQPAPVKEYQSSIRTMKEDISTIQQGQKPAGISVPRKVETPAPAPIAPKFTPPPSPGQFKVPSINLGQAERTAPLPQPKGPTPPMPIGRPAPAPQKPQIYAPPAPAGGMLGGRNRLYMMIGGIAVVFGALYWFFMLRVPAPEIVIETPTPTPTATPIQDLSTIFSNVAIQGVGVTSTDPVSDLIDTINATPSEINVNGGEFVKLNITSETKGQVLLGLLDFLLNPKQELIDSFGQDNIVLLYGQKESFDSKGVLVTNAPVEKRLVFISEVKDASLVSQEATAWEPTMATTLQGLFTFVANKQANPTFLDNYYQGTPIRYNNFPYSDRSIDYAVVSASNGKTYLVISNSRESMYSAIDKLK